MSIRDIIVFSSRVLSPRLSKKCYKKQKTKKQKKKEKKKHTHLNIVVGYDGLGGHGFYRHEL
jgi:hypothetical protein